MEEVEIRALVVNALQLARVESMRDERIARAFLEGRRDVTFETLDLDSLSAMELCIAIEVGTGVEIVPYRVQKLRSLNKLVRYIGSRS